jgi:cation diffusion facilitator family transporter
MSKEKISIASIFVNIMLAVFKLFVGFISMSSAILAEGVHSGMDIVSSGINYLGIRASKKPVDKEHPYGHYKSEVISGFMITIILFLSSLWIIYEAANDFFATKVLEISYLALGVMIASAVVNEVMARLKFKYGKKYDSVSLVADATHSRIDVLTSVGVLAGLLLSGYWVYMDSVVAILVGIYILWGSIKLGRETTDSLLDVSAGEEVENKIKDVVKKEGIQVL